MKIEQYRTRLRTLVHGALTECEGTLATDKEFDDLVNRAAAANTTGELVAVLGDLAFDAPSCMLLLVQAAVPGTDFGEVRDAPLKYDA